MIKEGDIKKGDRILNCSPTGNKVYRVFALKDGHFRSRSDDGCYLSVPYNYNVAPYNCYLYERWTDEEKFIYEMTGKLPDV